MSFTIKNYKKGLSEELHRTKTEKVIVNGPFGLGLKKGINKEGGTHLAFCAGTGILALLDLIALLASQQLNLLPSPVLPASFCLHLSLACDPSQSPWLPLLQSLHNFNESLAAPLFKLTLR